MSLLKQQGRGGNAQNWRLESMPGMSSFSPSRPAPHPFHSALCRRPVYMDLRMGSFIFCLPAKFDNWEVRVRDEGWGDGW